MRVWGLEFSSVYGSGVGLGSRDISQRTRDEMERGMEDGMTTGTICWLQRLGFWTNIWVGLKVLPGKANIGDIIFYISHVGSRSLDELPRTHRGG